MTKLSEEQVSRMTFICSCGQRTNLMKIRISTRDLVELLPLELRDKAQAMREKGKKPAAVVGKCSRCSRAFGALISAGQEEGRFDARDFRAKKASGGLTKIA